MSDLRACAACGRLQSYPVPVCRCGSTDDVLCAPPFPAEIYSHTRIQRAPTPALQAETPYTAVLVRGARGGLLLLRWRAEHEPAIGATIQVRDADGTLVAEPIEDPA